MDWNTDWARHLPTIHLAVTWYLLGLIWIVQRVQYPAMAFVDPKPDRAIAAERQHCDRIFWVVGPMMLLEGALASWLLWDGLMTGVWLLPALGLLLLIAIWGSTAMIQMPLHDRLLKGLDSQLQKKLVLTNWIRTAAWSLRAAIALAMAL